MARPNPPENEEARLAALHSFEVLDSAPEQGFDDLVAIAAGICAVPMASVSLIDRDRQWFKARLGLGEAETVRDTSFCAHAILNPDRVTVVNDATQDARFSDNPLVLEDNGIRFYAGAPLVSREGFALGTLCVIDRQPRRLEEFQLNALGALSRQVTHLLELRRISRQLSLQLRERDWYEQQLRHYQLELEQQNADLTELTRTDPLTGLPNRRAFAVALAAAIDQRGEGGEGCAVAVLDVDHFKTVNDVHGHDEGDRVLAALSDLLKAQFAGHGMAARYGGEEFVLLMRDLPLEQARLQCEYVRQAVAMLPIGPPVTVSIGLTACRAGDTPDELFKRADEALYLAKRGGRDQVVTVA